MRHLPEAGVKLSLEAGVKLLLEAGHGHGNYLRLGMSHLTEAGHYVPT
jgi:hypothetical protein